MSTMLTDTTKRNINLDLEEQGIETSKLGDERRNAPLSD